MFGPNPSAADGTEITDRPAESTRPVTSILGVACRVPFTSVPYMNGSGPSPSTDAKQRGGSFLTLCDWLRCSQQTEHISGIDRAEKGVDHE
jgi:hypothetical protein